MKTINLRKLYFPHYSKNVFVEVSDEVAEALLLMQREENNRRRKTYYHKAYYSLDCEDGIETAAIGWAQPSPEDYMIELEEQAAQKDMIQQLYEWLDELTPVQRRRIHARYMLGMKISDIAALEQITPGQVSDSIRGGIKKLRRRFLRQKRSSKL